MTRIKVGDRVRTPNGDVMTVRRDKGYGMPHRYYLTAATPIVAKGKAPRSRSASNVTFVESGELWESRRRLWLATHSGFTSYEQRTGHLDAAEDYQRRAMERGDYDPREMADHMNALEAARGAL